MFQGLRVGSPIYLFSKNEPKIDIAEVVSVGNPTPQYDITSFQNGNFLPPKNTVDIKVRVGEQVIDLQKLPADSSIADFGTTGMVVSESRDAVISEIDGYKKLSLRALDDVDRHKHVIAECDKMLGALNPQIKQEAERAQEIENIKAGMSNLQDEMTDIKAMLTKALNRSSSKKDE